MKRSFALTGAALMLGAVAGCGGGGGGGGGDAGAASTEEYCTELEQVQKEFGALESGNVSGAKLGSAFNRMQDLADKAPEPVADEWTMVDRTIGELESGLQELGLGFKDITDPEKLQSVDPKKLQEFGQKMERFGGEKFNKAGNTIEQHAKKECGIKNFGAS